MNRPQIGVVGITPFVGNSASLAIGVLELQTGKTESSGQTTHNRPLGEAAVHTRETLQRIVLELCTIALGDVQVGETGLFTTRKQKTPFILHGKRVWTSWVSGSDSASTIPDVSLSTARFQ